MHGSCVRPCFMQTSIFRVGAPRILCKIMSSNRLAFRLASHVQPSHRKQQCPDCVFFVNTSFVHIQESLAKIEIGFKFSQNSLKHWDWVGCSLGLCFCWCSEERWHLGIGPNQWALIDAYESSELILHFLWVNDIVWDYMKFICHFLFYMNWRIYIVQGQRLWI